MASSPGAVETVTVSATLGQSRSHSESQTDTTTTSGSLLKAGGDVKLTATERDLTVVGSTIQAGNDADLKAAGNLNLLSSQDRSSISNCRESPWSVCL